MTKQEFHEFYKKNKLVVFGVPFIVVIVLVNQLVLKPAREAKRAELYGKTAQATPATQAAAPGAAPAKKVITPPKPLVVPKIHDFSLEVKKRFAWDDNDPTNDGLQNRTKRYPFGPSKNVFKSPWIREETPQLPQMVVKEVVEKILPSFTYHGFFRMGKERIAILKRANRVLLTRAGGPVRETDYLLQSIAEDRVVVTEKNDHSKVFEIALMEKAAPVENVRAGGN